MAKFTRIASNPFARKLWFARLRAAGLFDKNCKRGKGACAKKTNATAGALKQTKYANLSPKSRRQKKETPTRGTKAIKELLAQGAKKGNSTPQQRAALARTLRKQGVQRGATTSLNKERARVKSKSGKTSATRVDTAVNVNKRRAANIKKAAAQSVAVATKGNLFSKAAPQSDNKKAAVKRKTTITPVTTKKRKK